MENAGKKELWIGIGAILVSTMTIVGYFADLSSILDRVFKSSPEKIPVSFIIKRPDELKFSGRTKVFLYSVNQFQADTEPDSDGTATFLVSPDNIGKPAKLKVQIGSYEYNKDILKLENDNLPKIVTLEPTN
jgi:hypothetical protein